MLRKQMCRLPFRYQTALTENARPRGPKSHVAAVFASVLAKALTPLMYLLFPSTPLIGAVIARRYFIVPSTPHAALAQTVADRCPRERACELRHFVRAVEGAQQMVRSLTTCYLPEGRCLCRVFVSQKSPNPRRPLAYGENIAKVDIKLTAAAWRSDKFLSGYPSFPRSMPS